MVSGSYTWSYSGSYTVGWRLTVSEDVVVTDLGQFDLGLDGLAHGTTVAIWEAESRSLVAQADLPALVTESAPLIGHFVYAALEPVRLPAGEYILGVQSYADWPDYYVYNAQITESAPVTWVEARHESIQHYLFAFQQQYTLDVFDQPSRRDFSAPCCAYAGGRPTPLGPVMTKNWLPLVSGPALAMASEPTS